MMEINGENFDKLITENEIVVIDFWAPWCGPCRSLGPIIDQVASELKESAVIAKVNIDENMELAERFNVQSIPTMIFFKNGKECKRSLGIATKSDIIAAIKAL